MPSSVFYYVRNPNLIIFESDAQASGHDAILITKAILDAAQQYHVERIYTAAAFTQSMSYRAHSNVLVASTSKALLAEVEQKDITPMPDGFIAGLNGLVLGVADTRSIPAACLLGTLPSYATNITYPKASLEIVNVLCRLLGADVDTSEMEAAVEQMDNQLVKVEDRIREIFPAVGEEDQEIRELGQDRVPDHVMERIEHLFQAVEKDHSRAPELKAELDRWKLYELYENRFLDIFDEDKNKD
jgi:proteasome assembly chaperone (PAC2) family protein